jgi:hypothetical protein
MVSKNLLADPFYATYTKEVSLPPTPPTSDHPPLFSSPSTTANQSKENTPTKDKQKKKEKCSMM